jgi:hypothetical protein
VAVNDQYKGEFMPGIRSGAPNLSPGSQGASGPGADSEPAGPVTLPGGAWQPGARYSAPTSGTVLSGQADTNQIVPGPQDGLTSTGAGEGSAGHWRRYSWQEGAS